MRNTITIKGKKYERVGNKYKSVDRKKHVVTSSTKFADRKPKSKPKSSSENISVTNNDSEISNNTSSEKPSVTGYVYKVNGQKVSQKQYTSYIGLMKEKNKSFQEKQTIPSKNAFSIKKYNPQTKSYENINPETGRTIISPKSYKVEGELVSKKEYENYIDNKISERKILKITKTKPQFFFRSKPNLESQPNKNKFFSPEQLFLDQNPNLQISDSAKIKRYYDDQGRISGITGKHLQQSIFAPKGSFFTESSIKEVELKSTAKKELGRDKIEEFFLAKEKQIKKDLIETGIFPNKWVGNEIFKSGIAPFRPYKKLFDNSKSFYDKKLKSGVDKAFLKLSSHQPKPFLTISEAGQFLANKVILGVKMKEDTKFDYSFKAIILGKNNFEQVPLHEIILKDQQKAKQITYALQDKTVQEWNKPGNKIIDKILKTTLMPTSESPTKTLRNTGNLALSFGSGLISHGAYDIAYSLTKKPITTTATYAGIIVAGSLIPYGSGIIGTTLSVKDWVSRPTAKDRFAAFGGDLTLSAVSFGVPRIARKISAKFDPSFRMVETDAFGRKTIKNVGITQGRNINIDLVPQKDFGLNVNVKKVLKTYSEDIPLKSKNDFFLPNVNTKQSKVLDVLKFGDEVLTGSFSQQVLLKKKFNRGFKDLDILSKDPEITASKILSNIEGVSVRKQPTAITIIDSKIGKDLVDIVPFKLGEAGAVLKYKTLEVGGLRFADPRARLGGKLIALSEGIKLDKTITDINLLTGGKANLDVRSQSVKGAFGFSFKEQSEFVGKSGDVISAQRDLFPKRAFGKYKDELKITKPGFEDSQKLEASFFASPWDPISKNPQLRGSRLGLIKNEAGLSDILSGDFQIGAGKPQAVIFPATKVAEIPSKLTGLYSKALKGDQSAKTEFFKAYKEFQMKPTGEFKPFGFAGGEAELTLAPGEIIKGAGKVGVTIIGNDVVPIIKAEISKSSSELLGLQKKFSQKSISSNQFFRMQDLLKSESGGLYSKSVGKPSVYPEKSISAFFQEKFNSPVSSGEIVSASVFKNIPSLNINSNKRTSLSFSKSSFNSIISSSFPNTSKLRRKQISKSKSNSIMQKPLSFNSMVSKAKSGHDFASLSSMSLAKSSSGFISRSKYFSSKYFSSKYFHSNIAGFNHQPNNVFKKLLNKKSLPISNQLKFYNPTLTSAVFGFVGKPSDFGVKSGLGIRPINIKQKKVKTKFLGVNL